MRLDPSKPLNEEIIRAWRHQPRAAPTQEPTAPSGVPGVANGAGASPPPRAPLTMTAQILRAAGRLPRW